MDIGPLFPIVDCALEVSVYEGLGAALKLFHGRTCEYLSPGVNERRVSACHGLWLGTKASLDLV